MAWSRTLQLDKLTSTNGQKLPYARQGTNIENFVYYFLNAEFYRGHFEPITDE
jgi:hypothetical protein